MAETKDGYVKPVAVESLKALDLDGPEVKLDLEEDAWSYGAPPPWGVYSFKLFLDKDGIVVGLEDQKKKDSVYFQFNLIAKIQDEGDWKDVPVFTRVNTKVFRGKSISTMAGLIVKMGYKIPDTLSPKKLALYMEQAIKKEPIIKGELDWRGAYAYKNKAGEDEYENVYRSYKDFPVDKETGEKKYILSVTNTHNGGMAEVRAMAQITRFFGKNDEIPKNIGLVSSPRGLVNGSPTKAAEVPELMLEGTTLRVAQSPQGNLPGSDDTDLALILA